MFGFGKVAPRWRKLTVLDLKTARPLKTAAAAAAGFKELLDAAGYFPNDKFMRSEATRDFREALKEQGSELKDHIEYLKEDLRDVVEQRTMLREDIEDSEESRESAQELRSQLQALEARLTQLRAEITSYALELAAFKADRADFVVAMANYTLDPASADPRIGRRLHQIQ